MIIVPADLDDAVDDTDITASEKYDLSYTKSIQLNGRYGNVVSGMDERTHRVSDYRHVNTVAASKNILC